MAVVITTYTLASGLMQQGMAWWQALGTILLGNVVVLVPMVLNAHAGTKYGVSFPVLCRASFGVRGANVPALLRAIVACGWFGIQTWIGGLALHTLLAVRRHTVNTLDIVPAGKPGPVQGVLPGQAARQGQGRADRESGWKHEFKTDEQGAFEATLPWRGGYVIEVQHTDATPGKLGEEAYDFVRCASTLFMRVGDGMQGPPQPAVTTPKRN